jgi:anti-sigma-K factor RskA
MSDRGAPQHHGIEELIGAYALDAVDPDEAAAVEAHLTDCPRCRAELDACREMAAALGNTVDQLPPHLWDRIAERTSGVPLHGVDRLTPTIPFGGDARGLLPPGEQAGPARPDPRPARRGDERAHRLRRRSLSLGVLGAAAMVALVVFLAVSLLQTDHELSSTRQALTDQSGKAGAQAALATPGHELVSLRSPSGTQVAEVVIVPDGRGYFVSSAMSELPSDETYQLWAMFGDRPVSLGLMGNHPGHVVFTVASGKPTQLAVTVEPSGGVVRPDRLPVASGSLTA